VAEDGVAAHEASDDMTERVLIICVGALLGVLVLVLFLLGAILVMGFVQNFSWMWPFGVAALIGAIAFPLWDRRHDR